MAQLFINNFRKTISGAINDSVTTIVLETGAGALLGTINVGDYYLLTLSDATETTHEVVKVTARSGDSLTVVRDFEGTAQSWADGSKIGARPTAQTFVDLQSQGFSYFESADITISSAGTGSVAHGLPSAPKFISAVLRCDTGEHNFSANDYVAVYSGEGEKDTGAGNGVVLSYNGATNIDYTFGSATSVFALANKSTGVRQDLTNGNWKLRIRAMA